MQKAQGHQNTSQQQMRFVSGTTPHQQAGATQQQRRHFMQQMQIGQAQQPAYRQHPQAANWVGAKKRRRFADRVILPEVS
jgi:hypothetical protein